MYSMMGANNLHRAGSPPANARNAANFESLSPQNVLATGAGWNGSMNPHHCLTTPGSCVYAYVHKCTDICTDRLQMCTHLCIRAPWVRLIV